MTKLQLRHNYLNNLEAMYSGQVDYSSGSRAREAAIRAADAALSGSIKLEGKAWDNALASVGLSATATRAQIAALPAE